MKNSLKSSIVPVLGVLLCSVLIGSVFNPMVKKDPLTLIVLITLSLLIIFIAPAKRRRNLRISGVMTSQALQAQFANAAASLMRAGIPKERVSNAVMSQSELRLEQLLTNTATVFKFPILVNATGAAPIRPTEIRLNYQDAFYCTNVAIYIASATSSTAVNFAPQTYPNPVTFATGAASLYALYNGQFQIAINKSVIVPAYPMMNFLQIPQTQLTAATNSPNSQFDPAQVALWQPSINFIGQKQNDISINLPGPITTIDANTYCIIKFMGVLAQNVTDFS